MRILQPIILSVLFLAACSSIRPVGSPEEVILGTWILESASFNGQKVSAEQMGGTISFTFTEEGIAVFETPEGTKEKGRYSIEDDKLIDPDKPDNPADIIQLNRDKFVVAMAEDGGVVVMNFRPKGR